MESDRSVSHNKEQGFLCGPVELSPNFTSSVAPQRTAYGRGTILGCPPPPPPLEITLNRRLGRSRIRTLCLKTTVLCATT
jgi:hypothetical protein